MIDLTELDREADDWPGVLSDLCQMDMLDWMGRERFADWMERGKR